MKKTNMEVGFHPYCGTGTHLKTKIMNSSVMICFRFLQKIISTGR